MVSPNTQTLAAQPEDQIYQQVLCKFGEAVLSSNSNQLVNLEVWSTQLAWELSPT